jgi:tetratricopeptide (TPR) repeat protein
MTELFDLVQTVLNTTPDDLDALLLNGKLAERRGNAAQALAAYDAAFTLEPTAPRTQSAYLDYLLRTGTDEEVKTALARLAGDPRIPLAKLRLSLEAIVPPTPALPTVRLVNLLGDVLNREPRMLVWAGQMLEKQSKFTDALAFYRAANKVCPTYADGWSARLLASARLGQTETTEALQQAQQALPRDAYFTMLAECATTVKARLPEWQLPALQADERRAYAQACVLVCEARSKLEDALPILTRLADDPQSPSADVEWAKRILTALTAAKGSAQERHDAIAKLSTGSGTIRSLDEARSRVAALMVAMRTNSGDDRRVIVREMIQILDAVVRDPKSASNDWFSLAQLHRMNGDRTAARRCLEQIVQREPNNLFYIAVNVDDLLSENRLDDVRPYVAKLKDGLHNVRVAAALGRYFTLTNDAQQVLEIADRFVRTADPGTTDRTMRERQAAELLDQLTRLANLRGLTCSKQLVTGAGEHYRAALKAYPDAIVPYTALLAFDGQVKPAFDELERYKKRLTPATLVLAGVGVLRSGFAEPAQFLMVQEWIETALGETPTSIPLKLNLAELHTLRQDFALAETLYRDVLKVEPKNVVALNNIAWILAPKPEAAEQALAFADRAIELFGATGEMLDTRARILIAAGKNERAIADLNDAINQGQSPLRYFHLAIAQFKMGNTSDAVKTFQLARARGLDGKAVHPYDLPLFKQLLEEAAKVN